MDTKTTPLLIAEMMALGLTQTEIARRTGLSQSTVSQQMTGRRGKRPGHDTVDAIKKLHSSVIRAARRRQRETAEAA
ncbi:helix-turn-helix domain-containing protein [Caballeronia sp. LZ043]|uniref:helix-turn-helix domain-containing protein n=1 Tax=Caballeronia sp. LZ043 TaxID=3038569 RepID=UPI00285EBEEB|nr:helix-turn-helix domain-containing protein [Caballeronia sp. LZ043]MDR5821967.1 helix-turn-helix domain-containing protein [Caballeronia sp. LZ043]